LYTLETDFVKTHRHSDETPFYYLLSAPLGKKHGMLLIQTLGTKTISDLFKWRLKSYFRQHYKRLTLKIEYYISKKAVKQFIANNAVREVVFRRHVLPADLANQVGGYKREDFNVELTIKNNKGNLFSTSKVMKFVSNQNTHFFTMPALAELGFDGNHDTLLRVKSGNSTRLVNLNDIYAFK
jgi:hypothetical protein